MSNCKRYITVPVMIEGTHYYAESTRIYLREHHHHTFKFEAAWRVEDANRQIEFHDAKFLIEKCIRNRFPKHASSPSIYDFGANSCEMLAEILFRLLEQTEYGAPFSVTVGEDDGCSGTYVAFSEKNPKEGSGLKEGNIWDNFPSFKRNDLAEGAKQGCTMESAVETFWEMLEKKLGEKKLKEDFSDMEKVEGKHIVLPKHWQDITFCVLSKEGDISPMDLRLDTYELYYDDKDKKAERAVFVLTPKRRRLPKNNK